MSYSEDSSLVGSLCFVTQTDSFLDVFDWGSAFELDAGDRYRLTMRTPRDPHSLVLFDQPVEYETQYRTG